MLAYFFSYFITPYAAQAQKPMRAAPTSTGRQYYFKSMPSLIAAGAARLITSADAADIFRFRQRPRFSHLARARAHAHSAKPQAAIGWPPSREKSAPSTGRAAMIRRCLRLLLLHAQRAPASCHYVAAAASAREKCQRAMYDIQRGFRHILCSIQCPQ